MFYTKETSLQCNTNPLVTVLIPVYNGIPHLNDTIDSILAQTYKNVEIILVDDGSKDTSKTVCIDYATKYPNVIKFISFDTNKGMDRALNEGIRVARGKYIARINQDDTMVIDRIAKQVSFLESNLEYTAVGGQIVMVTDDNKYFDTVNFPLTDNEIKERWMTFSPYSDPTVMYKRASVLKTTGYNQYFWPADDVHMWYMLGSLGKLANLPDVLTIVKWHKNAGSIKSHKRQIQKTWEVHKWASEFVRKPTLLEFLFWVSQYIAGVIFPPQFNWWVYRQLKKVLRVRLSLKRVSIQSTISKLLGFYGKSIGFSCN